MPGPFRRFIEASVEIAAIAIVLPIVAAWLIGL